MSDLTMSHLSTKHCESCEGIGHALTPEQLSHLMPQLSSEWQLANNNKEICRAFAFNNFHEVMAFMNAIAWIAHIENHHPDVELGYNYCRVHYTTHALDGLSHNDLICAAKLDGLLLK
ncbi:MAG: 4a-hydroxytetrahydrobiopterin dehydratase [Legionella sp.]